MSFDEIVIEVRGLSKRFEIYKAPHNRLKQMILPRVYRPIYALLRFFSRSLPLQHQDPVYFQEFWALKNVDFQVRRGESVGVIGRNGSGKSTLLQIIAGTLAQSAGNVDVTGRVAALLELGSGFNPEFTGRENVYLNGRILGLSQKEIDTKYKRIVDFADIGDFIDQPVKTYSSGMFVRLAFAVQAHIDASIVIIDEALAVGDVFFRQKCYARLEQLKASGAAILLVSHSMADIEQYCERAILLDHGSLVFIGDAKEAAKRYYLLHQKQQSTQILQVLPRDKSLDSLPKETIGSWPEATAFQAMSTKRQVAPGSAICTRLAICDAQNEPCTSFKQGEMAFFYYEFQITGVIGIPICGLVISNERGIIAHGKNSWQFQKAVPEIDGNSSLILCRHEIQLDLGIGEYTIEIGLASVNAESWARRDQISHAEMSALHDRQCHVPSAAAFSIGLNLRNGVPVLSHHGIANLNGDMNIFVQSRVLT